MEWFHLMTRKDNDMLENYFCDSRTLHQLRLGPLGSLMDDFSDMLGNEHYPKGTARTHIRNVSHLSRYLMWKGLDSIDNFNVEWIDDFLLNHLPNCICMRSFVGKHVTAPASMLKLREYLVAKGKIVEPVVEVDPKSPDGVVMRFQKYLAEIKATSKKTIDSYSHMVGHLLDARMQLHGSLDFAALTEADVIELHKAVCSLHESRSWKTNSTSIIRVFLRFLWWEKLTPAPLGRTIQPVRKWRLSEIPKALTAAELAKVLETPNRDTSIGKRDYAILVLLATVGMRASEIAALTLENFHWRKRVVTIPSCKSRRERDMPLTDEAFDALVDYLKHARPKVLDRRIFIRDKAPLRGFVSAAAITSLVSAHVIRSGIQRAVYKGPHLLRHTLATMLVNRGTPIKQVSDMLGHKEIETTRIYAKVDLTSLRKIANPFPTCNWR